MQRTLKYLGIFVCLSMAVSVQASEYHSARKSAALLEARRIETAILDQREWNRQNRKKIELRARVTGILSRFRNSLHHEPSLLADLIITKSEEHNLDPFLVLGIIKTESDFDRYAISPKGAIGLMQVKPHTARYLYGGDEDFPLLTDNEMNISLGTKYLSGLIRRFGSLEMALKAYNCGPTELSRRIESGEEACGGYSKKVIINYRSMKYGILL